MPGDRGKLPPSWGAPGMFASLVNLFLANNSLQGGLPASWMGPSSFPNLAFLDLAGNMLGGPLPAFSTSYHVGHLGNQYGVLSSLPPSLPLKQGCL